MPRQSDARSRFIDTAALLFRQRGYHAVGLTEIIEAAGAPKGSFYHHFPGGKEELAEHALRRAGRAVGRTIEAAFEAATSFEAGAESLAMTLAQWFEASGHAEGCPITSVLLDTVPGSERLGIATREVFDDWVERAATHATRLGASGDPRDRAMRLLVALEGAWIIARGMRSREPFMAAARMA